MTESRSRDEPPNSGPPALEAEPDRLFTIGELAAEFSLTTRAIRFYEARGLLAPVRKGVARSFTRRDRARLILILRGKNLGFSLEEIGEYLELHDADPTQVVQLRHLLAKLDAHIDDLTRKRADIDRTLRELDSLRAQTVRHLAEKRGDA